MVKESFKEDLKENSTANREKLGIILRNGVETGTVGGGWMAGMVVWILNKE